MLAAGGVAGIVGFFFYRPVLAAFGICILLAFHRAKVVRGLPLIGQLPIFGGLCVFIVFVFYWLCLLIDRQEADSHTTFAKQVAAYVRGTPQPGITRVPGVPDDVDLEKRPYFVGEVGQTYFLQGIPRMGIAAMVSMRNMGQPSALGKWQLHYQSPTTDKTFGFSEMPQTLNIPASPGAPKGIQFHNDETIYERTLRSIERGGQVRGWAFFEIPAYLFDEKELSSAVLTITFQDYLENQYALRFISKGAPLAPSDALYYPGVTDPLSTR